MEISIKMYAKKNGRSAQAARLRYAAGELPGRKMGGIILVEESTLWPVDGRTVSERKKKISKK